jgi:hypothetical protein
MIRKIFSYILAIAFLGSGMCFHPIYAQAQMPMHVFESSAQHELVCSQKECFDCCQSHDTSDEVSLQKPGREEDEILAPALTPTMLQLHNVDVVKSAFDTFILSKYSDHDPSYYLRRVLKTVVKRE